MTDFGFEAEGWLVLCLSMSSLVLLHGCKRFKKLIEKSRESQAQVAANHWHQEEERKDKIKRMQNKQKYHEKHIDKLSLPPAR